MGFGTRGNKIIQDTTTSIARNMRSKRDSGLSPVVLNSERKKTVPGKKFTGNTNPLPRRSTGLVRRSVVTGKTYIRCHRDHPPHRASSETKTVPFQRCASLPRVITCPTANIWLSWKLARTMSGPHSWVHHHTTSSHECRSDHVVTCAQTCYSRVDQNLHGQSV